VNRVAIIGAGVTGLLAAWHCRRRGREVTVIERATPRRDGCSFGNAGMVVPSHFVPLAAPGMIRLGLKWMWNPESPFAIRPAWSWELLEWLWRFRGACTRGHVARAAPVLRDLNLASRGLYERLHADLPGGIGLEPRGLVRLCRTAAGLEEEAHAAGMAARLGVAAEGERDVTRVPAVVAEKLLDHLAFVAETEHEVPEAVGGVDLHDVPEDRPVADRHHWLWTKLRLLPEPRSFAAAENHYLHIALAVM
jgi:glycine/D-amino acid oxidase-like deaminating enzyme